MELENTNVSGAKSAITQKKLDNLYKLVQMFKKPALVAKALGVDIRTLKTWVENGENELEKHRELASELSDCFLDGFIQAQDRIDEIHELLETEFLDKIKSPELNPKIIGRFEEFIKKKYNDFFEEIVSKSEDELIDNYIFSEHAGKNKSLKEYVKIARIFNRASLAMKNIYIGNIDKHAGTGANVGMSKWFLEITDDDFKTQPVKVDVNHTGSVSLLDLSLKAEKQTKDNSN